MTEDKEFNFNFYKTTFYGRYWKPDLVRAVVVLIHGMGEHSGRYTKFVIPKLVENNFGVITFDQFGHGKTTGKRGHNPNYKAVLESVSVVIKKAESVFGNADIFLYGHSMGGNVVINYALQKKHSLKGVIATSPFLKLSFRPATWKLMFGKLLQKIAPSVTLSTKMNTEALSRDKTQMEEYLNDPLIHNRISPNFSTVFFHWGKWAIENADKLTVPMLISHGTGDKITDYKASESFSKRSKKVTLKSYKGAYHELHNDLCKEQMMEDILYWLTSQL